MAIRVDLEGIQGILDGIGAGSSGSGLPVVDDGTRMAPYEDRPWQSKEASITSEALRLMAVPADQIRAIKPPVPYVLFPPDEGYDTTPLTIEQVLDTDRWSPKQRSWVSPDLRPYKRTDSPESGDGSGRNVGRSGSTFG